MKYSRSKADVSPYMGIFDKLDIPYVVSSEPSDFDSMGSSPHCDVFYDGEKFLIRKGGAVTAIDIVHELCHWLLSPEDKKVYKNFGLGSADFGNLKEYYKFGVPPKESYDYELRTCSLQFYLMKKFGFKKDQIMDVLDEYSFFVSFSSEETEKDIYKSEIQKGKELFSMLPDDYKKTLKKTILKKKKNV